MFGPMEISAEVDLIDALMDICLAVDDSAVN